MLAPYIGITGDFMAIIVSMHQAGVDAPTLDAAVRTARQDLLHMIRRFVETSRGLNDRRLWNQEWVAMFARIEAVITAHRGQ